VWHSIGTPIPGASQGGKNPGSGYLNQRELYLLGLLITLFFMVVFLTLGSAWILLVT
jgi:hypothetical protein